MADMIKHTILGGKVHVYKRENSTYWQCSTYMQGKNRHTSTKEASLQHAKQFAEDWYTPKDLVFPGSHLKMFNGILKRANLKLDRDGKARTSYSPRHTYICLRLMEGADIYQVAVRRQDISDRMWF